MNTTATIPDLRETSDTYAHVMHRQGLARVIRCRDALQWIIQTASAKRRTVWNSRSFCTTRKALIREWVRITGSIPTKALTSLPDTFTQYRQ